MSKVVVAQTNNVDEAIRKGLKFFIKPLKRIVLKPNLITAEPPPTTTPCETIEALTKYYLEAGCEVVVAEGSGWSETFEAYKKLGYLRLKEKYGVKLIDLNNDSFKLMRNQKAFFLKEFEFPLTLKDAYIISVPVLKEHSITYATLSLKNMLGATLGEKARIAKKGRFHEKLDESIVDVNLYLKPSLAVIDGRIAGVGGELKPKPKRLNVIIFSEDLVAADAVAAAYLGINPFSIRYLRLAQEAGLGTADLNKIKIVKISF
ncbi:MAG: DUF362 domain-containing protein [Candidatus Bathyarchaeia archaeon]